jgi:hypothetical protein
MKLCVTGCSGLVGSAFQAQARSAGHEVVPLVRTRDRPGIYWNPATGEIEADHLRGSAAVVHLAGDNVASGRWTTAKMTSIRSSRVDGTRLIARSLAGLPDGPRILISASAIGFYGDRGDQIVDEQSSAGSGFLADVCRDWEAETRPAEDAGLRVVRVRIGVVLSKHGGALAKMLFPFRWGIGGIVGHGRQYWSWVAIDDVAGALLHVIATPDVTGPVNAVAPHPVTNREFTKTLGRVLRRPTILPMPALAARIAFGRMADDLLLSSTRVAPTKLAECGYQCRRPDLEAALRSILLEPC